MEWSTDQGILIDLYNQITMEEIEIIQSQLEDQDQILTQTLGILAVLDQPMTTQ
jgi:hypothetical protein